jgi:hypothetical protein
LPCASSSRFIPPFAGSFLAWLSNRGLAAARLRYDAEMYRQLGFFLPTISLMESDSSLGELFSFPFRALRETSERCGCNIPFLSFAFHWANDKKLVQGIVTQGSLADSATAGLSDGTPVEL